MAAPIWDYTGRVVAGISVRPGKQDEYRKIEYVQTIIKEIASKASAKLVIKSRRNKYL